MVGADSLRRLGCTLSVLLLTWLLSLDRAAARPLTSRGNESSRHRVVVRHYTLNVTDATLFQACAPFGPTSVVNATFPGPTLRARAGDILQVRVWNHMSSGANLTMHFHGLSMRQHPVMDGTLMVSQWPITGGKFFDYRIPLTAEDKGTYFYHSHVGVQAMTAYGVLIVEDPEGEEVLDPATAEDGDGEEEFVNVNGSEGLDVSGASGPNSPYAYGADRVIAVGDWWDYSSPDQVERQLSANPFVWPGTASRLLVNGLSSPSPSTPAACNQTAADALGVSCQSAPAHCQTTPYPELHLDYDTTYRLRFVGATSLMYVSLAILKPSATPYAARLSDDAMEELTLIEADGSYVDALDVRHVEITTGQRYSALYRSRTSHQVKQDATGGIYWMRLESRWRAGPSMWVKLVYPNATYGATPPVDTGVSAGGDVQLLPAETFGWVTSQLSPLSTQGGAHWWYSASMPGDDKVTRTVVVDAQQVKFYPSRKGVRWAEDGQVYNESYPSTAEPYLVRTLLGDVSFPTAAQFEGALYNPTSYNLTNSSGADTEQSIISDGEAEREAAQRRHWGQGYDAALNMYFARTHEVVDIVIVNKPSELSSSVEIHPWHMHSKKHWSRTIQPGTFTFQRLQHLYNNDNSSPTDAERRDKAEVGDFSRPIQRDTTVVYASPGAAFLNATVPNPTVQDGGFSVLRYKVSARDAGVFLLHCHIQFHLYMGMATVWTIAPDQLANQTGIYWPTNTHQQPTVQGLNSSYFTYGEDVAAIA